MYSWNGCLANDSPTRQDEMSKNSCPNALHKLLEVRANMTSKFHWFHDSNPSGHLPNKTQMQELVKTKCSRDLVFFLCSVLLPICISDWEGTHTEIIHPMVPPCRSVCESVYNDCIQTIRNLNVGWPGMLNCSGLPDHDEGICIAPNAFVSVTATPAPYKLKDQCAFLS